ncbi:phasin family protein [Candidatus Hepatobacter penaei]|uniref:phasin family protein n=1 Tax=Candidatus Hepatobacter penaei TaxID=1274402 RepID=UPI0004F2849D|nr:phasin family protein [Candidatus Hepatobacter penaei]TGW15468.1 phasin family protein [bacterium NHP-B]
MSDRENETSFEGQNQKTFGEAHHKDTQNKFQWKGKELPLEALLASHRKNMDAVRQAQQAASDLVRDVAQLNGQYARHSFDDICRQTRTFFTEASMPKNMNPEPMVSAIKSSFERSMSHYKQVTELFSQSTSKIFNSYKKRFDEGLQEAQDLSKHKEN